MKKCAARNTKSQDKNVSSPPAVGVWGKAGF